MRKTTLPLAVLAALAIAPAQAQQYPTYPQQSELQRSPGGSAAMGMQQAELAPVSDVVVAVEQRLDQLGYDTSVDGRFDADLRNSVMLFQSDNGLRPTGEVDLSTIAALGINVDPAGRVTAMAPAPTTSATPPTTATPIEQQASVPVDDNSADFPLLRDEHMSAPMIGLEEGNRFENYTGVPQPNSVIRSGNIPGVEPGFPIENLLD